MNFPQPAIFDNNNLIGGKTEHTFQVTFAEDSNVKIILNDPGLKQGIFHPDIT